MSDWLLRFYGLMMWLAQPLFRRKIARRSQLETGYSEAIEERFGHYSQPAEATSELLWIHAVSLGETRTAAILLKALRIRQPDLRILLTHGTATGRAEGRALLRPGDVQVWQPWDSPAAVKRFFSHFKPRQGWLMETEIWPCTVATAKKMAIPLVLVNGRLSEKTLQQTLKLSQLAYPAYAALSQVYVQTADDARRFRQLGVMVDGVFGNLKFDATPDASQLSLGKSWRQNLQQPVLMFASSREGEEIAFFKQISALAQVQRAQAAINKVAKSKCHYLVVPRHPQRFDEVAALAAQSGLSVSRRSSWPAGGPAENSEALAADIWLGDSLGEMALYYALSDVALLGGSFEKLGGQNLIEAAACGCPVVMGPHTFNFAEAAAMAETAGAAQRAADLPQAVEAATALLQNPAAQASAASAGLAFAAQNRGATEKTLLALGLH